MHLLIRFNVNMSISFFFYLLYQLFHYYDVFFYNTFTFSYLYNCIKPKFIYLFIYIFIYLFIYLYSHLSIYLFCYLSLFIENTFFSLGIFLYSQVIKPIFIEYFNIYSFFHMFVYVNKYNIIYTRSLYI